MFDININIVECKSKIRRIINFYDTYININIVECKCCSTRREIRPAHNININIVECKSQYGSTTKVGNFI